MPVTKFQGTSQNCKEGLSLAKARPTMVGSRTTYYYEAAAQISMSIPNVSKKCSEHAV
jgi:hypothetical protein